MKLDCRVEKKESSRGRGGTKQSEKGAGRNEEKRRDVVGKRLAARLNKLGEGVTRKITAGTLLARGMGGADGSAGQRMCGMGKKRKDEKKEAEAGAARSEPEQSRDDGLSDEIVREFLVESSTQPEPAGKYSCGRGFGHGGYELRPGVGGEPGHVECHGEGAGAADTARFSEVIRDSILIHQF